MKKSIASFSIHSHQFLYAISFVGTEWSNQRFQKSIHRSSSKQRVVKKISRKCTRRLLDLGLKRGAENQRIPRKISGRPFDRQKIFLLSGGEQQRVALARLFWKNQRSSLQMSQQPLLIKRTKESSFKHYKNWMQKELRSLWSPMIQHWQQNSIMCWTWMNGRNQSNKPYLCVHSVGFVW